MAFSAIISYSDKPLRMAIRFGSILSLLAFAYALYIAYRALAYGSPVEGWSSLIVSIYFLGGVIIAILGMIGLYLGKTFDQTKQRPLYIVRRKT